MSLNTLEEQIKLLSADANGVRIQQQELTGTTWIDKFGHSWDFKNIRYREYVIPDHTFEDEDVLELTVSSEGVSVHFDETAAEYQEIRFSIKDLEYLIKRCKESKE